MVTEQEVAIIYVELNAENTPIDVGIRKLKVPRNIDTEEIEEIFRQKYGDKVVLNIYPIKEE